MNIRKFFDSPAWGVIMIILGIALLSSGTEWYSYLIGLLGLGTGIHNLYKNATNKKDDKLKPICEFCGYIALDERELHNHQINCEKKKSTN